MRDLAGLSEQGSWVGWRGLNIRVSSPSDHVFIHFASIDIYRTRTVTIPPH
jgi:hypothetical protein